MIRQILSWILWTTPGLTILTKGLPNKWEVGGVPFEAPEVVARVRADLLTAGIPVTEYYVDVAEYHRWLRRADYPPGSYADADYGRHVFSEKSLEHFVAAKLLSFRPGDIYIDVASALSPAPEIYHRLYGCLSYRQDLAYPVGVHDNVIGGDATAMPVPDGFADKMSLHCSFEHFEGERDTMFIQEAHRVLKPGGKLCILPLYMYTRYAIQTDVSTWLFGGRPNFDQDACLYLARGFGNRWGRFYDVGHFVSRIASHLTELQLQLLCLQNEREIHPSCHLKFILLLEKPR